MIPSNISLKTIELSEIKNLPDTYKDVRPEWLHLNKLEPPNENTETHEVNFITVGRKNSIVLKILDSPHGFSNLSIVKPSKFLDYESTDTLPEYIKIYLKIISNDKEVLQSIDVTDNLHLFTKDNPFMSLYFFSKHKVPTVNDLGIESMSYLKFASPQLHIINNSDNDVTVSLRYSFTKLKFDEVTLDKIFENISTFTTKIGDDVLDYKKLINS